MASVGDTTTKSSDSSDKVNTSLTSEEKGSESGAVIEDEDLQKDVPSDAGDSHNVDMDDVAIDYDDDDDDDDNGSQNQSAAAADQQVKPDSVAALPPSPKSPSSKITEELKTGASAKSNNKSLSHSHTPPKSSKKPQSQTPPAPATPDSSDDFGPFINPASANTEWNPFDGDAAPSEMFQIADDDDNTVNPANVTDSVAEEEINRLRMIFDSEYEKALQDQEISWKARYTATRLSFVISALLMVSYLWLGCMFYRSEAGWSIADSLLFTVYTVTTVGYGGPQPLPNTGAFHAFTCMYILLGISGVTVLGAHTYQLITLEATRIRSSPLKEKRNSQGGQNDNSFDSEEERDNVLSREMTRRKEQFMTELDDLVRQQPFFAAALDYCIDRFKETRDYLQTTKSGRILAVTLPFTGMILFGALVVGLIEGWSPLESIYWSIVTLTTVGYGDYVPTKNSAVWFCTIFFIPSSLFFLSFFLAQVAKSYIQLHASYVVQWERRIRRKHEKKRAAAKRSEEAQQNAEEATFQSEENAASDKATAPQSPDEENTVFRTINFTEEEEEGAGSNGLFFGDQAGNINSSPNRGLSSVLSAEDTPAMKYRETVIRNKHAAPDPQGKRVVSFAEALRSLKQSTASERNTKSDESDHPSESVRGMKRPSLGVRLRVQERLAKIIAVEVAGHQTGVIIKGSTVSLTIGSLHDTADKWKIPPRAWKAFRAVAFRSLLFVGERDLISDGVDALMRLNVMEFHGIFSPILAVMGDGNAMEAWLAATDLLADVELQQSHDDRRHSGRGKQQVFNGAFA